MIARLALILLFGLVTGAYEWVFTNGEPRVVYALAGVVLGLVSAALLLHPETRRSIEARISRVHGLVLFVAGAVIVRSVLEWGDPAIGLLVGWSMALVLAPTAAPDVFRDHPD